AATRENRGIAFDLLADIASECFMPMCYGGGVQSMDDLDRLFSIGIEKVSINTRAVEQPALVEQAAEAFGSQSIVVSVDVRRGRGGHPSVHTRSATQDTRLDPAEHGRRMQGAGAGELLVTSADREGTGEGYDL